MKPSQASCCESCMPCYFADSEQTLCKLSCRYCTGEPRIVIVDRVSTTTFGPFVIFFIIFIYEMWVWGWLTFQCCYGGDSVTPWNGYYHLLKKLAFASTLNHRPLHFYLDTDVGKIPRFAGS